MLVINSSFVLEVSTMDKVIRPTMNELIIPPPNPAQVLLGLMEGMSLGPPMVRPNRNAPISVAQTDAIIQVTMVRPCSMSLSKSIDMQGVVMSTMPLMSHLLRSGMVSVRFFVLLMRLVHSKLIKIAHMSIKIW